MCGVVWFLSVGGMEVREASAPFDSRCDLCTCLFLFSNWLAEFRHDVSVILDWFMIGTHDPSVSSVRCVAPVLPLPAVAWRPPRLLLLVAVLSVLL